MDDFTASVVGSDTWTSILGHLYSFKGDGNNRLWNILWVDWHLEVSVQKIQLKEDTGYTYTGCDVRDVRHDVVIWLCADVETHYSLCMVTKYYLSLVSCTTKWAQRLVDLGHAHLLYMYLQERFFSNIEQFWSDAAIS